MIHGFCNHLYYYICFTQTHITLLEDSCCFPLLFAHRYFSFSFPFVELSSLYASHILLNFAHFFFSFLPSFINVRILFRIASKFKYRDKKQTTIKAQLLSFSDVHFQQITQKLIFRVIINSHFVNSRNSLFFLIYSTGGIVKLKGNL